MVKEIFKKHQSGLWVSNIGRVWIPQGKRGMKSHFTYGCLNKQGYLMVGYKGKVYLVHRLVAEVFIPNPMNKPEVDHINRNKQDNRVANLRWATRSENNYNRGEYHQPLNSHKPKIILQYTKSGEFIKEWPSAHEVERTLGFNNGNIFKCCLGKSKTSYGFIWKYKEDC